jgi:Ca-activated chloride channel family protein
MRRSFRRLSICALCSLIFTAAAADDAVLVLDGSGSMWGQIDGKSKAEIAKAVVGDLLVQIPADRRLGLVAYGHRREGDCTDIEEVAAIGADRAAIKSAVNKLGFKGKTPLTAAVRFAAETLRYAEQKATVILVTDGAETCKADPCALGAELEASGVDFTAHVIGFGLASPTEEAGLKCLAEATGGKYVSAKNAAELTRALQQTAAAKPVAAPPSAARVVLRATELLGGPEIASGLEWTVTGAGGVAVLQRANAGEVAAELPPGDYSVSVVRASDGLKGSGSVAAKAGSEKTLTIALQFKLDAALTLTPSGSAPAGSAVSVKWSGPNRPGDYVTVVKTGASVAEYLDYAETKSGNPLEITLPVEPGAYEMRYVLGRPQRVLASAPIAAAATSASLAAPASAGAGASIAVSWNGPAQSGDWVTVVKPDAAPQAYNSYFDVKPGDKPGDGRLTMPLEPGDYQLRYVQGGKKVIATTPIKVVAVVASVTGPTTAIAGGDATLSFAGPAGAGDWVTVVKPDAQASAYNDYFDATSSKRTLVMPTEPGAFEFRYVQGGQKIIARSPVTLTAPSATITAPASVAPGAAFDISWTGPNFRGDWLTIVTSDQPAQQYGSYVDVSPAGKGKLTAPAAAGTYELRYVLRGKAVIARKPIVVK